VVAKKHNRPKNDLTVRLVFMSKDPYDIDEVFSLNIDPEDAIKSILDGAGTEGEVEMDEDESEDEA
jgi:hypothetical protein